ncbi:unnamed protein product [Rotaria socialis]
MADWDALPKLASSRRITVNLNNVTSAPARITTVTTDSKIFIAVAATGVVVLLMASVLVPISLALTYTGPFTTTISSITTTTDTTTTTTTTTDTTTTTTTDALSECSSYTTINDVTRLTTAGSGSGCDTAVFNSTTACVRFSGAGGTQLATSAPASNQCTTQAPGWYSGSLPGSGVSNNETVCYAWSLNNCKWSNTIQVTNCGSFYVWGLISPPVCNLRYCTA